MAGSEDEDEDEDLVVSSCDLDRFDMVVVHLGRIGKD
tara:strand:- start:69 stop:179 length:111 start_codon:yes stop_codon:yes gene_type:complete